MPEATSKATFPGDWFRPSDIGYLDEDGFFYYSDRAGDTIRTTAGAVYPHMVEAAILRHPAVANCGVVGIGDPDGQTVVAAVLLKAAQQPGDDLAAALLASIETDLKEHERPTRLEFLDELPTVLGGAKVQRSVLRERLSKS